MESEKNPSVIVYCGPMYSGKSTALFDIYNHYNGLGKKVQAIKPNIDKRYSTNSIITHSKKEIPNSSVANLSINLPQEEWKNLNFGLEVFLIDEAQFFEIQIVDFIKRLMNIGKEIHIAGLDLDSKGLPFGYMPQILALATNVKKFEGKCKKCGNRYATRTYRKPEVKEDSQVLIGGEEIYESRCYNCWKL